MDRILSREHQGHLKERVAEEFRLYWVIFFYLALMFGAFIIYRRLIMREVGIDYAHWGAGVIQAAHVPGAASVPGGYPGKICSPVCGFFGPL